MALAKKPCTLKKCFNKNSRQHVRALRPLDDFFCVPIKKRFLAVLTIACGNEGRAFYLLDAKKNLIKIAFGQCVKICQRVIRKCEKNLIKINSCSLFLLLAEGNKE